MYHRLLFLSALSLASPLAMVARGHAQQPQRFLYAGAPSVGNQADHGRVGILVFDIDRGYKFVKRIPTWTSPEGRPAEGVRGIAASAEMVRRQRGGRHADHHDRQGRLAHNTIYSDDGAHAYLESQGRVPPFITVTDARTHTVVKQIGRSTTSCGHLRSMASRR